MLRNSLLVAIRNLFRYRFFSIINLLGLSIGFSACLIIWMYVSHERSYDGFHKNVDQIYRINQTYIWGDDDALFASTGPAVKQAIADEVPEFEALTRLHTPGNFIFSHTNTSDEPVAYDEDNILAADPNFFDLFSFPLLEGNPQTALVQPNSVILTEETAKKYFGDQNPIGKQLQFGKIGNLKSLLITGVAKEIPENSHIQFDILLSMSTFPRVEQANDSWMWTTFVTFGKLRSDADPALVAKKVADVPAKYLESFLQKYRGISYEEFLAAGETWDLYIQPMKDIHLSGAEIYSRISETNDRQTIYIILFIGMMIFTLSLINYINLSTARATARSKEVGVRKVIGSSRFQLIRQFLTESLLYILVSLGFAVALTELSLPFVEQITGLSLSLVDTLTPQNWLVFGGLLIGISLLSSYYPAWILSSFRPAAALKSGTTLNVGGSQIRNLLVAVQFAISILMIASTFIIADQVKYWRNIDLGFDRQNQLIVKSAHRLGSSLEVFKNQMMAHAQVENVSISSDTPPMIFDYDNFTRTGKENINLAVNYLTADENFLETYGLSLTHGRNLEKEFFDSTNILVNHQFLESFNFNSAAEALQQKVQYNQTEFTIVGIIEDFETSLSSQTYPTVILDPKAPIFRNPNTHLTIRIKEHIKGDQMAAFIQEVHAVWNGFQPALPLTYSFADLEYTQLFESNIQFGKLIGALSILSTIIASLGLIGLVAFVLEKRRKEIGIRKVLGASIQQIWLLLSSNFGYLMFIGLIIGGFTSWWIMDHWIANFAVRKTITIWPFLFSGLVMLLVAIAAVSFQIIQAARINPIEYLHEE